MSKTLSNVRSVVRSQLDEASAADWSDAELNKLINLYYHNVRTAVITTYEDYYMTTANWNSTASQQEYTSSDGVPTDIFKIRRLELNYDVSATSGAPTRLLPLNNIDAVRRDLGYTNSGIGLKVYGNAFYYTFGFESNITIGIIPKPDKTGTDAFKIWYIPIAADLTSDSETLNLPFAEKCFMLVCYGATAEALRFGNQEPEAARDFEGKYIKGLLMFQEELEDKEASESKSVLDVQGQMLDFDAPS